MSTRTPASAAAAPPTAAAPPSPGSAAPSPSTSAAPSTPSPPTQATPHPPTSHLPTPHPPTQRPPTPHPPTPPPPAPPGEDLSGLGTPAARAFLLAPWASAVLYTAAVWPELARPPLAAAALGVLLAEILAVSRPGRTVAGLSAVVAAVAPVTTCALLVLATAGDLHGRMWTVQLSGFYTSLLLVRGRPRLSWSAFALQAGLLVAAAVGTGQVAALPALLVLQTAAMAVGVYWRRMLVANARDAERARRAADEAAALAAANRTAAARAFTQLAGIRALTRATLVDLSAADALTGELRERAARLEVTVREGLRAPRLATEPVRGAVLRARDRGVVVRLLDDSQGAPVHPAVLERVAAALDSARGEAVVRLAPPGRDYAATVLVDDGDVRALRIGPDGR